MPVTNVYHGQQFFGREATIRGPRRVATPLFVVLVETTALIFAVPEACCCPRIAKH